MAKEMLINVSEGEECRIALLDNGKLEELYMERTSSTSHVGNIYKGKVTNVEPSIQAAFVDFGLGRNGFLHISDLMPSYFGRSGNDIQESVGKKMARRDRPPIQRCLRRGDEIIVQIIKEGIGTKGPTLSTYLSIPGRILVMMPGMGKMGVSKKIEDEAERKRLRTILDSLKPPKGVGFIIRTAGIGKSKAEIQRDLTYLSRLWQQIEKKRESGPGAMELYTEGDLVTRTVRDVFSTDVDSIIIDSKDVAKRVKDVIKITAPRTRNKVETYEEPLPLFHKYGIERDIELMYSRHVPLPSGGSLVIDSTEAIVAIDVNSGKFRDHSDAEMTAFKTDMEAADEIPRQLKLRDLGGVIICDFIDLRYERHRRELEERLHENFKKDRAKTKVLRMSQFGIIEITRQRMRPSLKRSIYFDCPHCKGAGLVKTPESMSLDVMRRLAIAANHEKVMRVELSVCPDVSFYLLNKKRNALATLESSTGKKVIVRTEQGLGLDETMFALYDARDGLVLIDELGLASSQPPHTTQLGTRAHGAGRGRQDGRGGRGGRGQDQRGGGGRSGRPEPQRSGRAREEGRFELDDAEDAAEEREERREQVAADPALVASIAPKIVHDVPTGDTGAPDQRDGIDDEQDAEPVEAQASAQRGQPDDADDETDEDADSSVVDVDDGHSALGERPAGEWERHGDRDGGGQGRRRRRRGRRGGRGGSGEGDNGGQAQGQRPQEQRDQRPPQSQGQRPPQQQGPRPQHPQGQRPPQPQGQRPGQQQFRHGQPSQRPPQQPNRLPPAAAMASYGDDSEERPGPGNEKFPGQGGEIPPALGSGGDEAGGGKRRRRRRGGRRHRRRRERENEMRQQAGLEGLPQGDELDGDYDDAPTASSASDEVMSDAGSDRPQDDSPAPADEAAATAPVNEDHSAESVPEVEILSELDAEREADEAAEEEPAPPAKKKRTSRAKASPSKATKSPKPKAAKATTSRRAAPKRTPPKKAADKDRTDGKSSAKTSLASVVETPVIKTGSADKHLVDDDPAEAASPRRPSRRYDLDEIPDDYD